MILCILFINQLSQQHHLLRKNKKMMEPWMIGLEIDGPGMLMILVESHSHHHTILSGTLVMISGTVFTNHHNHLLIRGAKMTELLTIGSVIGGPDMLTLSVMNRSHLHIIQNGIPEMTSGIAFTRQSLV
jgi:hypothetical protein